MAGIKGNDTEYYHHDGHGNVTAVTDENGAVLKSYEYDAFGVELNEDASDGNPFRYCGAYYDKETGLYYLINRYYDPSLGRFTQRDPTKDGSNWYIYCYNDPINLLDALGLKPTKEAAAYLASHIYDYGKDNAVNSPMVAGWKIVDVPDTSPRIGVYIPAGDSVENASEYAIVFRGTDNLGDVVSDFQEKYLTNSQDMKEVISFAKQFANEHQGKEITFVGHSKGGGEAIAAATATNGHAITFNAANFNFSGYGLQAPKDKYKIENYYVEGEFLHEMIGYAEYGTTMPLLPTQDYYPLPGFVDLSWNVGYSANPYANHSMSAVMRALGIGVR